MEVVGFLSGGSGTKTLGSQSGLLDLVNSNLRKGEEEKPFTPGSWSLLTLGCWWTPGSDSFRHGSMFLGVLWKVCLLDFVSHVRN